MATSSVEEKINRVCYFIEEQPYEDFSLQDLSEVAELSKYHFQRVFKSVVGVTPHRYILLSRLRRASFELLYRRDLKIIDVAISAGFESPEAFTRAFTRVFSQTPKAFRNRPDWSKWAREFDITIPVRDRQYNVNVFDYPSIKCAAITHRGFYLEGLKTYDALFNFIVKNQYLTREQLKATPLLIIPNANPLKIEESEYTCEHCIPFEGEIAPNDEGVSSVMLPGGSFAVLTYVGPREPNGISHAIQYILNEWMPQTEWEWGGRPAAFVYDNSPLLFPDTELITHICLPIEPKTQ
ncbi:AraC family transcriptional regulator [Vibrio azureus]|uniref:Putative AraC family transcriptional regulator n=1 Tax=Vibrio azureus NBRC 104587 TaxID=1219077 RepID=U3C328_9VIBR|nr:helix-turn-helix domain-containing protein [Vibrio azureus]AUI86724.1 AraC family transcriptional regulator [Vibrio azureus]GAD75824.1 putative AraC family transcriptional regulator [Vibrio azureus NBRC 104587]